jgi:hypothetical protein
MSGSPIVLMDAASTVSPWPKRILIVGVILSIIGFGIYASQSEEILSFYDPSESAQFHVQNGGDQIVDLGAGCWIASVEGDGSEIDLKLNPSDGNSVNTTSESLSTCKHNYESNNDFSKITSFEIKESGTYYLSIECDECDDVVIHLNHDDESVMALLSNVWFLVSITLCCLGFLLIPFGWILMMINGGKTVEVQLIQNQIDQSMDPSGEEVTEIPTGEMLTTDQIYHLMRGKIPEISQDDDIPSPFANTDTRKQVVPQKQTGGSTNVASNFTAEQPPTDDSWKGWDEG